MVLDRGSAFYQDFLGVKMPQFQVLDAAPNFGSQLGQQLGSGISQGIGQSLGEYFKQKQNMRALEGLKPLYTQAGLPEDQFDSFVRSGMDQKNALAALELGIKAQVDKQKFLQEQMEKQQELQGLKDTLNQLEEDIPYTGTAIFGKKSFFGNIPGTEAYQKREEFDSSGFLAADKVFTHFNKGTISKEKLKKISEDLAPRSDLSEKKNIARIASLRRIMGLPKDISEKKLDQFIAHEKKRMGIESPSQERPPLESFYK